MATISAMIMAGAAAASMAPCKLTSVSSSSVCASRSGGLNVSRMIVRAPFSSTTRCLAEPQESKQEVPDTPTTPLTPLPISPLPITPPAPKKPKVSTNFFDIFSFAGPAPERINGRLAMLGFVTALGVELATGEDLATQLNMGGIQWFIITAALFTAASLIPMFKGVSADSKSKEVFSSSAENWNGRLAMIGLIALAVTEFVKGSPLV